MFLKENMTSLSKSYACAMPDWARAKYFDPEAERNRVAIHDYQQTEIRKLRCMDNCNLSDTINLPRLMR